MQFRRHPPLLGGRRVHSENCPVSGACRLRGAAAKLCRMSPVKVSDRFDPDRITEPAAVRPENLEIAGADPHSRGLRRGALAGPGISRAVDGYSSLVSQAGITAARQQEAAEQSLAALARWDPAQHEELVGVAEGSGLSQWQVGLVNARTEILALAGVEPLECSTLVHSAPGRSLAVQTWDWHAEFADIWHLQRVAGLPEEHHHAGFAEYGMLGKIGVNSAGVGVMLNILRHESDAAGGVPIHSVLAAVLARAGSMGEALQIIHSAPTTSSSVITVSTADEVVMVEIAPGGKAELRGAGWFAHTNHFLAPELQDGARPLSAASRSEERLDLVLARVAGASPPEGTADMLEHMCTGPGEAPVCRNAEAGAPFGERLATLVTAQFDPAAGTAVLSPGSPVDLATGRAVSAEFRVL
jgi:isopenicillin-N N-acyltransferase like protein